MTLAFALVSGRALGLVFFSFANFIELCLHTLKRYPRGDVTGKVYRLRDSHSRTSNLTASYLLFDHRDDKQIAAVFEAFNKNI